MITQQELDALILIIQRAPMNQAEIIAINAIVEKLARATQQAQNDANGDNRTTGGNEHAGPASDLAAAAPAD